MPGANVTNGSPLKVHYGFTLDGCLTYRNISKAVDFGPLVYYPNPDVEKYPGPNQGVKKYEKEHKLVIKVSIIHLFYTPVVSHIYHTMCVHSLTLDF